MSVCSTSRHYWEKSPWVLKIGAVRLYLTPGSSSFRLVTGVADPCLESAMGGMRTYKMNINSNKIELLLVWEVVFKVAQPCEHQLAV